MKVSMDKEFEIQEEVIFADFLRTRGAYYQAERLVKDYYTNQGYFVLYCPSLTDLLSGNLGYDKTYRDITSQKNYRIAMDILSKKLSLLFYINSIFRGFPDLIVFDLVKKDFFLVEAKRNDSIMTNQILFFILARDIFNICDIRLVRVKPNGSYVRKKKSIKITLRKAFDDYIVDFNSRRKYEIKRYREIDQEVIRRLEETMKRLSKQKKILNDGFYDETVEKTKQKIQFLKTIKYSENHALSQLFDMWISRDFVKLNERYMRKLARKVLKKRSVNYEHNEYVKMKARGRNVKTKPDKSYLRLRFSPN